MAEWDDPDFHVPELPCEDEEETYFAPRQALSPPPIEDDRPVLLVDLAELAAQLGDLGVESFAKVREHVVATLHSDFNGRVSELLASGMCWHTMRSCCEDERRAREAARTGSFLTVIDYPAEIDGNPLNVMWAVVVRPTAWECVDAMKTHVMRCNRSVKFKVDVVLELEALAEREDELAAGRAAARHRLVTLQEQRACELGEMQESHEHDKSPLSPDDVSRMLATLDLLDESIDEAEEACAEAAAAGCMEAAEGERSSVELLLDLVFEFYPTEPHGSWIELVPHLAQHKVDLLRMWSATFGRLPAASATALKHAAPPTARAAGTRPRMLVPLPPSAHQLVSARPYTSHRHEDTPRAARYVSDIGTHTRHTDELSEVW